MTSSHRWYVVHTLPNREPRADLNLRRQGFTTYLPCYKRNRRHARRTDTVVRPLFPRYLFVAIVLGRDRWRSILSTFGVSGLVFSGEVPVPVPNGVVEEIRAREDNDGLIRPGLPAGAGIGTQVRLIDGIFENAQGVIDRLHDEHRVAVLLKLLGREVRVFVPAASIGIA